MSYATAVLVERPGGCLHGVRSHRTATDRRPGRSRKNFVGRRGFEGPSCASSPPSRSFRAPPPLAASVVLRSVASRATQNGRHLLRRSRHATRQRECAARGTPCAARASNTSAVEPTRRKVTPGRPEEESLHSRSPGLHVIQFGQGRLRSGEKPARSRADGRPGRADLPRNPRRAFACPADCRPRLRVRLPCLPAARQLPSI